MCSVVSPIQNETNQIVHYATFANRDTTFNWTGIDATQYDQNILVCYTTPWIGHHDIVPNSQLNVIPMYHIHTKQKSKKNYLIMHNSLSVHS